MNFFFALHRFSHTRFCDLYLVAYQSVTSFLNATSFFSLNSWHKSITWFSVLYSKSDFKFLYSKKGLVETNGSKQQKILTFSWYYKITRTKIQTIFIGQQMESGWKQEDKKNKLKIKILKPKMLLNHYFPSIFLSSNVQGMLLCKICIRDFAYRVFLPPPGIWKANQEGTTWFPLIWRQIKIRKHVDF